MREIRFRAWDKDDEEMHKDVTPMYRDGELENIIFDYENAGYDFVDIEIKYCDTVFLYEDNPYIIMQYTGLKDKNGKEIYEGDIVKQIPKEGYEHIIANGDLGIIKSSFGSCTIINAKDGRTHFFFYTEQEVLGNIYQHPELLGDSQ